MDFDGRTIDYTYNYAGWLTSETWVSGSYSAAYAYDLDGELTSASDSASTYTYAYDSIGQVDQTKVSYTGASGMGTVTLTYGYHFLGQRTSFSDNEGGSTSYSYNNNDQLTALDFTEGSVQANVSLSYNTGSDDSLSQIEMDAGSGTDHITAAYSYSSTTLGIVYTDSSSNTLPTLNYTMNNDGLVTAYSGPEGTLSYAYDKDGQLTSVTGAETYTYNFDSNGNRSTGYTTTTGNEMTADAAGDASMSYDYDGNLTSMVDAAGNHWTYTWDYDNRLTEVVEKNSGATTVVDEKFTYDVFGNLVSDDVVTSPNGASQRWTVFDGKNPYMDFNSSGTLTTFYLDDPQTLNEYFARVAASGSNPVAWYLTDYQQSIRAIVQQNGTVLDTINYDPFGSISSSTGSTLGRFLFEGGEYFSNLSLYHFGARWESPADGRWISQDPIGFAAGDANLYRFSDNNPVNFMDYSGTSGIASVAQLAGDARDTIGKPLVWF